MSERFYQLSCHRDSFGNIAAFEILNDEHRKYFLNTWQAGAVSEFVMEILNSAQVGKTLTLNETMQLDEHLGAHVLLVVRAVKSLAGFERTCRIAQGIARMSREEATYWHAHAQHKGGLPALRKLLAS